MTTPRVYYVQLGATGITEQRTYPSDIETILLSDHKEVVRSLEQTISELKDHRNTSANILVETRALVQRQALAIEKLKELWLDELEDNCWGEVGDMDERNFERVKAAYWAEITAILQEAK